MNKVLTIYHTTDLHGYFYPTTYSDFVEKPMGLFACASGFQKDGNTLVIDGGDSLQGSAYSYFFSHFPQNPQALADCMNACGYDFFTIGNHDFNYGMDYLRQYIKAMNAVCVCENVTDEEDKSLYPYQIKTMENGLKVGIVGIVTDYVNVWEQPKNIEGIKIVGPFEKAKAALSSMKNQVDLTICVYHGGFECDLDTGLSNATNTENVGYKICQELDFDIMLTGHQHMSLDGRYINHTYVVQSLDRGVEYQTIRVELQDGVKKITSEKRKPSCEKNAVLEQLKEKFKGYEAEVQKWLDEPLGYLNKELLPEDKVTMAYYGSPIADFINKVQFHFTDADVSVVGLANDIAGFRKIVSNRDVIATYPYPNTLVVCRMTGEKLKRVMERSAEYFAYDESGNLCVAKSFLDPKVEHYNYDYFAGVSYQIDAKKPVGERIVNLSFKGKAVRPEDEYKVVVNNYRYSGAGEYPEYPTCSIVQEINTEMVDLIMDYFRIYPEVIV